PGQQETAIVGSKQATTGDFMTKIEEAVSKTIPNVGFKHEIITQDPKLYMDDDDDN
ncbi:hypothetical protein JTB14_007374, partial [Gonioctena quinquepunctata]